MSKVDGTLYKCDRCGRTKFLSCAEITTEGGLAAHGVYKLSVGKKKDIHLCADCFLHFCEFLGVKQADVDTTI